MKILDCTLRDGGYYNNWDFSSDLVDCYLKSMAALEIDFIEIGFRSLENDGFKGAFAYSTDGFLQNLNIPESLKSRIGVMVNASELISGEISLTNALEKMFVERSNSPISLVRIACHANEFERVLPAATWLKEKGYIVGFNLMQADSIDLDEAPKLLELASNYPIDVLYFADSAGSMSEGKVGLLVNVFKKHWNGEIGIHAHDNMLKGVSNTLLAASQGVSWLDSTVTGMGRGAGNAQTEYIILSLRGGSEMGGMSKLFSLIEKHFVPMKTKFNWGSNPYYYLSGEFGIHPSYVQHMMQDPRYTHEDMVAIVQYLGDRDSRKFNMDKINSAKNFFSQSVSGNWQPKRDMSGRSVLIIGSGPSVRRYKEAIQGYIVEKKPYVIALNTQSDIDQELINIRVACHPVRLLADFHEHSKFHQPLAVPLSMLPEDVREKFNFKMTLDYGLEVDSSHFSFEESSCVLPNLLVASYALAIANSGRVENINLVGFDGFDAKDSRMKEMEDTLKIYTESGGISLTSLTPTNYNLPVKSIFGP